MTPHIQQKNKGTGNLNMRLLSTWISFGVHGPYPCYGGQETERTNFVDRMFTATRLLDF